MLEYLDPVALPLLDVTATRYRWRKFFQSFHLLDGSLYYNGYASSMWNDGQLFAVSSKANDYVRGLAIDGRQVRLDLPSNESGQLSLSEYWELEAFVVPRSLTNAEEMTSSLNM